MQSIIRSIRKVFRNRGRMILIVTLLSLSLMFVAAMTSLSTNSQQELATVHKLVGNTITINYTSNNASSGQQGNAGGSGLNGPGFFGGPPTPIPDSVVAQVKHVQGVVSTQVSLSRMDQDDNLQGTTMTLPNGQSMNAPLTVDGIDPTTSASFTMPGGITPTLVSGRAFRASDAHADIAMMSQAVAQVNHLSVGSTFTLKGTTFSLIGLYTSSNQLGDSTVIIPVAVMEKIFQTHGVDSITATVASYEQAEPVATRLRSALGNKFGVTTQTAQYSQVFSALQVAQQSIQIAQVVSLVIAAAVTIFAVVQLVRERTAEIAILKALGSSHLQVLQQFWIEIVTLSAVAASLAILLLVTLGPFVAQKFDIDPASLVKASTAPGQNFFTGVVGGPTISLNANPLSGVHLAAATLSPETLLIIVGVGVGLALLASFIPTWFVSTIKPAQVLRAA